MAIGFQRGRFYDETRADWSGKSARPMVWSAWYPADPTGLSPRKARERIFCEAERYDRAPLAGNALPLVVLSHGNAGAAEGMSWLAERLAHAGFVVIGVDHHGNTATEAYRPEAFLAWWERARDLSCLIDYHMGKGPFASALDPARIFAAGFSLGGYSVLAAMGGVSDVARYEAWLAQSGFVQTLREFPDLPAMFSTLYDKNETFRQSWGRQGDLYLDGRIKAALLCAPASMVHAFSEESLKGINAPIGLIVGGADLHTPADLCADWLADLLPNAVLQHLHKDAAHYVFMSECTGLGRRTAAYLCEDAKGVDRAAAHDQAAALALSLFK